jgi:hypothetical protein
MIIPLQFSEIMGCANLFQRFLTLAVNCVSTPSILLSRVHVTWLVHKWSFIHTCAICVICYVLKRISSSILHFSSLIFFIRSVQILQWPYRNYLVRISTTKRVLTGFSTKIKIKKITDRIKNISELKCNIELEIRFKT